MTEQKVHSKIEAIARQVVANIKGTVDKIFYRKSPSGNAYAVIAKNEFMEDLVMHNITEHILNIPGYTAEILTVELTNIVKSWASKELPETNFNVTNTLVGKAVADLFKDCKTDIINQKDEIVNYYVCNTPKFSKHFKNVFHGLLVLCNEERTEVVRKGKEWTNTYIGPRGLKSLEYFKRAYNIRAPFSIPKVSPATSPELVGLLEYTGVSAAAFGYTIIGHLLAQQFVVQNIDTTDLAASMMGGV